MISPMTSKIIGCLPRGVLRFVAKTILNGYIKKYANINITGYENIKDLDKPILFVCNHLSNSDALIIDKILKNQDITFVAGVKLNSNELTKLGMEITKTVCIKPNSADKQAISNIIKTLKAGNNMLIFPEGTRSRTGQLMEPKKGVILIKKLSKATLVPLGLSGTEKLLPINDKNMALESFQNADVTLNIGKPLELPKKVKEETKHEYEKRCIDLIMYKIADLLPEEYRGVYKI